MGHIRLGTLPKTRKWREVISLLENDNIPVADIAAASFTASLKGLEKAPKDQGLIYSFWLLAQLATAAQGKNFIGDLRGAGLPLPDEPSLLDITGAFTKATDRHLQQIKGRTDIAEMALMSATETITDIVGPKTENLFGTTSEDIQRAFKDLSTRKEFGALSREFFSRFTQRYLSYFISRELSNHVGGDKRLQDIAAHTEFTKALKLHCYQAAEILETFSGGWFSKTKYLNGEITDNNAHEYVYVALKKLRAELTKRGDATDEQ